MNDISVMWSFRNRLPELLKSLDTANKTCQPEIEFHLVDAASNDETIRELRSYCNGMDRKIRVTESSYRTSLSEAWNLGMMLTDRRYIIFASSDVEFIKPGWVESIKSSLDSGNEYILMDNHSVFGFDKKAIPKMGWFDEEFIPGPHFDVDFMIRASERGVKFSTVSNAGFYTHHGIGGTYMERIKNPVENYLPMNDFTNEHVFKAKWQTQWPGWEQAFINGAHDVPHPPTHISQVRRSKPEIDPHPLFTKKYV